jgi:nitrate/TMAO reductase-like tetraheme cytochrome c subunit
LPPPAKKSFSTHIRTPEGSPKVKTAQVDPHGKPALVRCATCHAVNDPNESIHSGAELKTFHQGLKYQHGNLTCVSCHHRDDYDSLRGADNRRIPYANVMELCSQCHGPQARDYAHGAHGGMTGHWDLSKGPRLRNNCIDCHDPHHPAYPKVQPVFPPKDRFTPAAHGGHE